MGCVGSSPGAGPESGSIGNIQELPIERKLDPKDFVFSNRKAETLIKEPGSIAGQSFNIDNCQDCDIYLLDYSAAVTIDDCQDCRIFIGPCESSVFLRDCRKCNIIVACQQLRTRDCHDISMLLYCGAGQPSIETSSLIRLGCFRFYYFELQRQFEAAGLNPFSNQWSNVYDFQASTGPHWEFLPLDSKKALLKPLERAQAEAEPHTESQLNSVESKNQCASDPFVVPDSCGPQRRPPGQHVIVTISPASSLEQAYHILQQISSEIASAELVLVQSRVLHASGSSASANKNSNAKTSSSNSCIKLEFVYQNVSALAALEQACASNVVTPSVKVSVQQGGNVEDESSS